MELSTAGEVMDALGGNAGVAKLTNSTLKAVWNWRKDNYFPSDTFVVLKCALADRGIDAPASLWGMREVVTS